MLLIKRLGSGITFFLFLYLIPFSSAGQGIRISGKVTDTNGNPLVNVSIIIKGTSIGTTTSTDGSYHLSVIKPSGNTLLFSSVGFTKKEIFQAGHNTINVQLEKSDQTLDQVVVIGYGTQKKEDVTGSVATLDEKRLGDMPNSNFAQALEGALPGVRVITSGGGSEGSNSILIRGQKSITASTDPLIVLDGIPYNGSISDISTTDIASINVLKDASAAAIYGSRASNGVILITTKEGSSNGKPVVSYDTYTGRYEWKIN